MKELNRPKRFSVIARDAKGPYFLCYGPDLLTLRSDLNKALSAVTVPKRIEIADVHSREHPCVIVKGKTDELEKLRAYLAAHERYTQR